MIAVEGERLGKNPWNTKYKIVGKAVPDTFKSSSGFLKKVFCFFVFFCFNLVFIVWLINLLRFFAFWKFSCFTFSDYWFQFIVPF